MKLTKEISYALLGAGLLAIGIAVSLLITQYQTAFGSNNDMASDYSSTSTAPYAFLGSQTAVSNRQILKGFGSFGSVIIEGANTGALNFYDATTTDVTKRAATMSTSSILLASIPPGAAAGTYVFDIGFHNGLLMDVFTGTVPTTTITFRP